MSTPTPASRRYHLYRFLPTDPAPFGVEGDTFPAWWDRYIAPEDGEVWVPIADERWAARVRPGDIVWFAREDEVFGVAVVTRVQHDPVHRRYEVWWSKEAACLDFSGPHLSGVWHTRRVTHAQAQRWFATAQLSETELVASAQEYLVPAEPALTEPAPPPARVEVEFETFHAPSAPAPSVRSWEPTQGEIAAVMLVAQAAREGRLALMPVRLVDGSARTMLIVRLPDQAPGVSNFFPAAILCRAGDSVTLATGSTLLLSGPTPPPHVPTTHDN